MAAIDCGTNSIRLLVVDVGVGSLRDVTRQMQIVRLGEGVDASGRLSEDALTRTWAALDGYAEIIRSSGVEPDAVRFVATSATRDAANRDEFVDGVRARLGIEPEVLSGDEEAALSFVGARSALPTGTPPLWLVVDIGGGSTECVLGGAAGVTAAKSIDIGCVRITERCLQDDPPTPEQVAAAIEVIDAALAEVAAVVPVTSAGSVVGLAGSVTTVAAIALGLDEYDAAAIHGSRIPAGAVHEIAVRLLDMSHEQRAALSLIHPGRLDVIGAGALILDRVLLAAGVDAVIASEHDILDGIALDLARGPA